MQTVINLKTEEGIVKKELSIDNSSVYKEFKMDFERRDVKGSIRTLSVQNDTENGYLTINEIVLSGLELQLFKEFINQVR